MKTASEILCRWRLTFDAVYIYKINELTHEILTLITYARAPLSNANADVFSGAGCLKFGQSLHRHQYYQYANS